MTETAKIFITWMLELIQYMLFARTAYFQKILYGKKKICTAILVAVAFFITAVIFMETKVIILLTASLILFMILLEGNRRHCFVIFWASYWFVNKINDILSVFLSVCGRSCYVYLEEYPEKWVLSIVGIFVIFMLGQALKGEKESIKNLPDSFYGLSSFGGGIFFFCVSPAVQFGRQFSSRAVQGVFVLGSALSEILFYMLLYVFFIIDKKRMDYQARNVLQESMLQASKDYCREILDNEKEIRKLRHDFKNHVTVMQHLLQDREYQRLSGYLADISEEVKKASWMPGTVGNEILDAVLAKFMQREPEISFQVEGELSRADIHDYDLCVIFSNALANAVEACRLLEKQEKIIEIYLKKTGANDILIIRNPVEWEIDSDSIGKVTTKKDRKNHGYGIAKIRETAEKYDGSVDFEITGRIFQITVILTEK